MPRWAGNCFLENEVRHGLSDAEIRERLLEIDRNPDVNASSDGDFFEEVLFQQSDEEKLSDKQRAKALRIIKKYG